MAASSLTTSRYSQLAEKSLTIIPKTLLSHVWITWNLWAAASFPIFLYVLSLLFQYQQRHFPGNCKLVTRSGWESQFKLLLMGASGSAVVILLSRFAATMVSRFTSINVISAYFTVLVIMTISFSGEVLMNVGLFSQVCEDCFGVRSPIIQMAEWQSTVPLMILLNVTLDTQKTNLSVSDISIIIAGYLGIVFSYVPIFSDFYTGAIMICGSVVCFSFVAFSVLENAARGLYHSLPDSATDAARFISFSIGVRRIRAAWILNAIFIVIASVYFLRTARIINHDQAFVLFSLLNFLTKDIYALYMMEGHLEVLDPALYEFLSETKANTSRRTFIRYIFHEVRSPLNSLIMGLNVLKEGASEFMKGWDDGKETLSLMGESAIYMNDTLNDILSLQKIEEDMMDLQSSDKKLLELALNPISNYAELLKEKCVTVSLEIHPDVPSVIKCDGAGLELVICNLLSNAIKFSNENSGVKMGFYTTVDVVGDVSLVFSIMDEGVGISDEVRKVLFTPYAQLRPGEMKSGRGPGVGLVICKEIVEMHSGSIWFKSAEEMGVKLANPNNTVNKCKTTMDYPFPSLSNHRGAAGKIGSFFFFSIPISGKVESIGSLIKRQPLSVGQISIEGGFMYIFNPSPDESPRMSSWKKISGKNDASAAGKSFSVIAEARASAGLQGDAAISDQNDCAVNKEFRFLVVDDVLSNRKVLSTLLKKRGIGSDQAINGHEAVSMVEANINRYDVIFMDNMMPVQNGVQATAEIRAIGFKNLILGLTGNTLLADTLEFEEAGADAVFFKPLNVRKLDALLEYIKNNGAKTIIGSRTPVREDGTRQVALYQELTKYQKL